MGDLNHGVHTISQDLFGRLLANCVAVKINNVVLVRNDALTLNKHILARLADAPISDEFLAAYGSITTTVDPWGTFIESDTAVCAVIVGEEQKICFIEI